MTTMALVPKHWYSWDFTLENNDRIVADLDLSCWREKGTLTVEGVEHRVFREGIFGGDFVLEARGQVLARATKPSAFRHTLHITRNDRTYTLRKKSVWRREFILLEGDTQIGSVSPKNLWMRDASVQLPDDWPLPVRAFVIWLAVILWKRDADAASGGA